MSPQSQRAEVILLEKKQVMKIKQKNIIQGIICSEETQESCHFLIFTFFPKAQAAFQFIIMLQRLFLYPAIILSQTK
jgi:hypothetical protein